MKTRDYKDLIVYRKAYELALRVIERQMVFLI